MHFQPANFKLLTAKHYLTGGAGCNTSLKGVKTIPLHLKTVSFYYFYIMPRQWKRMADRCVPASVKKKKGTEVSNRFQRRAGQSDQLRQQ